MDFGTYAWARANNGQMSRTEQVREAVSAARVILRAAPAHVRHVLGFRNPRALTTDPDQIPIPDSQIAREAEELCREASPAHLLNHSFRTYVWGMLLGQQDRLRPDPELLFVGSMLHDLALTERFRDYAPMPCFGARAAIHAVDWASARGWSETRCTTLADAITLHLNSRVPADHGPEAQLLQAGAGLDVIGLRHWQLAPTTVASVIARYPRLSLKASYGDFKREAHPGTRAHLLDRWLGFGTLARFAPFAE